MIWDDKDVDISDLMSVGIKECRQPLGLTTFQNCLNSGVSKSPQREPSLFIAVHVTKILTRIQKLGQAIVEIV